MNALSKRVRCLGSTIYLLCLLTPVDQPPNQKLNAPITADGRFIDRQRAMSKSDFPGTFILEQSKESDISYNFKF
jgi:hypothetical protein